MNTTIENLNDLNQLILSGKPLEAFEKYYDEKVVMQENEDEPTIGKDANRKREIEFFSSITNLKDASVTGLAVNNDVAFVKWHYDYEHKDWGHKKFTQVSVQQWANGRIIHEQFFYNA